MSVGKPNRNPVLAEQLNDEGNRLRDAGDVFGAETACRALPPSHPPGLPPFTTRIDRSLQLNTPVMSLAVELARGYTRWRSIQHDLRE